jgi:hypothetical protein
VPLGYGELAINRPRILLREDGHWDRISLLLDYVINPARRLTTNNHRSGA